MTNVPKLLTVDEAAERLGCRPSRIRLLCRQGRLPYPPFRPKLLDEADVEAFARAEKARLPPQRDSPEAAAANARRVYALRKLRASRRPASQA